MRTRGKVTRRRGSFEQVRRVVKSKQQPWALKSINFDIAVSFRGTLPAIVPWVEPFAARTGRGHEVDFLGLSRLYRVSYLFSAIHRRLADECECGPALSNEAPTSVCS